MKPVRLRPLAQDDLIEKASHYVRTAGAEVGSRFFDGAIDALRSLEEMPGIGSPTVGELAGVADLRRVGIKGFPCGWLHFERADRLDVVRLLADRQDLAMLLELPEE